MSDDTNLFRNGSHIYFYDSITDIAALDLIRLLLETDADLNGKYNHAFSPVPQPIWLHICSYGGFVFTAFSLREVVGGAYFRHSCKLLELEIDAQVDGTRVV